MCKFISFFMSFCIIASAVIMQTAAADSYTAQNISEELYEIERVSASPDSYAYFLDHKAYPTAEGPELNAVNLSQYKGSDGLPRTDWEVLSPQDGRYYLKFTYVNTSGNREQAEFGLLVNGETQYIELSSFVLECEYYDLSKPELDIYGNEIRPEHAVSTKPATNYAYDYTYSYSEPLSVNLNKGVNTLTLTALGGTAEVESIILQPAGNVRSYSEQLELYKSEGISEGAETLVLEAEDYELKSSTTLFPVADRTSAATSPSKAGKIRLNTVGGSRWSSAGQYFVWEVDIKKSGLYRISLRFRQNTAPGQSSARVLYINNNIPFKEAAELSFGYDSSWQAATLGGETDFLFYFTEGRNQIKLQNTYGKMDRVLRVLLDCIDGFNLIYREFLTVLGSSPDLFRDYRLDVLYPEQIAALKTYAERLEVCADYIEEYCGRGNSGAALIRSFIRQLNNMYSNPDEIPKEFSYFKTNIGSLSTWISDAGEQPLEIDSFTFGNDKEKLPKAGTGFFKQLLFSVKEYLASYVTDYELIGSKTAGEKKTLTVWVSAGREQAQIVRDLAAKSFTPQSGISVSVKNVTNSLLPATVAGIGPDLVVQSSPDVFNFAMRGAAYPLSEFDDAEEVAARFDEASLITMRYLGNLYGLPETVSFNMMFYRTDIFEELGIKVPQTWDELIEISTVLANNNMQIGVPSDSNTYLMMLKQAGGEIYAEGGKYSLLDTVKAISVFTKFTNLFVNYGFPISFDFLNRFRSGEMPIGIANYGMFNNIQVAAPEINGLWSMAPVPGMEREDGTVDRTSLAAVGAAMILADTKYPAEAWEFLKWWTGAEAQISFADEIESILGKSSRYNSANKEAFENSNWTSDQKDVIIEQKRQLSAVEPVPGGYYLSRNLDNAFRNVVYHGMSPTDAMYEYTYEINSELTKKRLEFGLETRE